MAAFLDIGILGAFSIIFVFLLVFVLLYGTLSWVKPFGGNQTGIYAIIALAFAVLSIANNNILRMIYFLAPWFFILIFISFIVLFLLMLFGWDMKTLAQRATTSNFKTYAIVLIVVLIVFGLGSSFGQDTLNAGAGSPNSKTGDVQQTNIQDTGTTPSVTDVNPTDLPNIGNTKQGTGTPEGTSTNNFGTNALNTLVNPQVLGMLLVLLVGAFAMFFITKSTVD